MTASFADKIKTHALSLGFDLIGFSPIKVNNAAYSHYKRWLEKGMHADLLYMSEKERAKKRSTAKSLLPNAKTVISLAVNYYHKQPPLPHGHGGNSHGRIAMYAYGRDYHKVIGKKLKELEKFIQNIPTTTPQYITLSYVDTGPILERTFAVQAGLGFIGKNTTLITPDYGSFVFLAEIITDLEIPQNKPTRQVKKSARTGFISCGSCTRCIDACPTKALTKALTRTTPKAFLDAKKCIAYHTIENKAPVSKIPSKIRQAIKQSKYIFGCDICQLACPHNCRAKPSESRNKIYKELKNPKIAGDSLPLKKIISLKSNEEFLSVFAGSSLTRAKLKGLKRNAKILLT